MNLNKFVENVKIFSKEKGKSPTAACVEAGLSRTFLTDTTNKNTNPRIDSIFALSQYFGVTVSELLGEVSTPVSELDTIPCEVAAAYAAASPELQAAVKRVLGVE